MLIKRMLYSLLLIATLTLVRFSSCSGSVSCSTCAECGGASSIIAMPGQGTTAIAANAFSDCASLTEVVISGTVTTVGNYAFANCKKLLSITVPDSVVSLGSYFCYNCYSLEFVSLSANLVSIPERSFMNCYRLASITLPDTVTSFGYGAFFTSGLNSIIIPEGVTTLDSSVFQQCYQLTTVTLPSSLSAIDSSVFSLNLNLNCVIGDRALLVSGGCLGCPLRGCDGTTSAPTTTPTAILASSVPTASPTVAPNEVSPDASTDDTGTAADQTLVYISIALSAVAIVVSSVAIYVMYHGSRRIEMPGVNGYELKVKPSEERYVP